MQGNTVIMVTFGVYLAVMLFIGWLAGRGMKENEEGFFLGNRSFGFYSTAMSSAATDTSGWIFIGAVGYAYAAGAEFMWMLGAYALGGMTSWLVLGPALRRQSEELGALDLAEYFEKRLKDHSHLIRTTATIIILLFFIPYLGSQLTSAGITMNTIMQMDYNLAMFLCMVIIVLYSFSGGYRAVMWTDSIQGTVMCLVLAVFPIWLIHYCGGWTTLWVKIQEFDPLMATASYGRAPMAIASYVLGMMVMGFGTCGQPQNLQRYFSTKDADNTFFDGVWVKGAFNLISMTGSCVLGITARVILPDLANPEYAFPSLAFQLLPPVIVGIIIAGIFSAIQSTYDSMLILSAQSISRDLVGTLGKRELSDKQRVALSRWVIVILGILSFVLAILNIDSVFALIIYAQSVFAAAFGPLLILLLFWPHRVDKRGAFCGMIVGTVVTTAWYASGLNAYIWEVAPGSLSAVIAILLLSKPSELKMPAGAEAS